MRDPALDLSGEPIRRSGIAGYRQRGLGHDRPGIKSNADRQIGMDSVGIDEMEQVVPGRLGRRNCHARGIGAHADGYELLVERRLQRRRRAAHGDRLLLRRIKCEARS